MEDLGILEEFMILFAIDLVMTFVTTFCLASLLNMNDVKKRNKELETENEELTELTAKQSKEIEQMRNVIYEYRDTIGDIVSKARNQGLTD